ncbi:hypothetical protein [Streptomyces platensis]
MDDRVTRLAVAHRDLPVRMRCHARDQGLVSSSPEKRRCRVRADISLRAPRSQISLPSQLSAWQQTRITAARAAAWARNSWATAQPRNRTARPHAAAGSARATR